MNSEVTHCFKGRCMTIWQRNFRVWTKGLLAAMVGNFGEPLLILVVFGYGLGFFVGSVEGLPYQVFLASGIVCSSAMQTATFESLYSAYTRMAIQHTWIGMLSTPLNVLDIVIGEALWAGTKALLSAAPILIVAAFMDATHGWQVLWVLPVTLLLGVCFGAMGLVVTALAQNFDSFLYYFTLFITPLVLLSGVFFPMHSLPPLVQNGVELFPLSHALALVRPLMIGQEVTNAWFHCAVLIVYSVAGIALARRLIHRRLLA